VLQFSVNVGARYFLASKAQTTTCAISLPVATINEILQQ
jgi:hypothetical protein